MTRSGGFFEQVYRLVRLVPRGQVTSYGAIARMLGNPRGARTVGWALGSLPHGSDVPWQRVLNSRGEVPMMGEDCGARQRELLEAEGVEFGADGRVDLTRFGWEGLTPWEVQGVLGSASRVD